MTPNTPSSTNSGNRCTIAKRPNWPGAGRRSFSGSIWGEVGYRTAGRLTLRADVLDKAPDQQWNVEALSLDRFRHNIEEDRHAVDQDELIVLPPLKRSSTMARLPSPSELLNLTPASVIAAVIG